jgi:hypothetical protein
LNERRLSMLRRISIFLALFSFLASSAFAAPGKLYHRETPTSGIELKVEIVPGVPAAVGGAPPNTFTIILTWAASSSAAGCTSSATPACSNFGYNVFEGTASGGEGTTPINSAPVTALTYSYPVSLTSTATTYYFVVQAVETLAGIGTANSVNSNEVSVAFPAAPVAPVLNPPTA